uniref:NADH-ubiquinone oxidoreductase chain 6 n=1 Tax=Aphelocheirus jendeki TaxID=2021939 RepID=A0A343ISB0_9HEMI|nr:NADH dehydrogenase subunit 6 [Aphelocheirus jendeki]AST10109.1 NADH dehydrogenase subunit 6 [Aphelocheirus jendeki]
MLFFMWNLIILSMIFPFMKHPLSMGLILILQTMTVSMITGIMMNSFWFSYILFIILLGGALVLFIYMASIASNEKFSFSTKMMSTVIIMLTSNIIFIFMKDEIYFNSIWNLSIKSLNENEQLMTLIKLFNSQSMSLTILLVIYLLLTMIAITNVVNTFEGPMRSKS